MEAVAVAASIVTLTETAAKMSEGLLRLKARDHGEMKRIALEISISLQKILVWQETWSGSRVSAKALWGVQGWTKVQKLLDNVVGTGEKIERLLQLELHESRKNQPNLRWKRAFGSIRKRRPFGQQQQLQDLANTLNKSIDELWIHSEILFDSLHGLLAIKPSTTERDTIDTLLESAVQSRAGSLKLHDLCLNQTEDCNLEMDLLDDGLAWKSLKQRDGATLALTFSLVTEPKENELRKLAVKHVQEIEVSNHDIPESIEPGPSTFRLFQAWPHNKVIGVPHPGRGSQHYLRIVQQQFRAIDLRTNPESLAKILKGTEDTTNLSTKQYLSITSKIQLALKVTECGFFPLGTPWFSSLSSKNLRRSNTPAEENARFMLRIQTLDYEDLLYDDPGALAETSQLFRLGVVLMDIALNTHDVDNRSGRFQYDLDKISKLPLVEEAMGAQYCKATAFCLQDRRDRFQGPEKYEAKLYTEWETYLTSFLEEYYSQVYLRLQELSKYFDINQATRTHSHGDLGMPNRV